MGVSFVGGVLKGSQVHGNPTNGMCLLLEPAPFLELFCLPPSGALVSSWPPEVGVSGQLIEGFWLAPLLRFVGPFKPGLDCQNFSFPSGLVLIT